MYVTAIVCIDGEGGVFIDGENVCIDWVSYGIDGGVVCNDGGDACIDGWDVHIVCHRVLSLILRPSLRLIPAPTDEAQRLICTVAVPRNVCL